MKELYNALPDDRPVTAICVIEDPTKCPSGFSVVAKSYDQDLDADLHKDGFFAKRVTRYLCLSKTEGPPGFVIDSLCIINERDNPPTEFILLHKIWNSDQKAWRKRQLCYRLTAIDSCFLAITDIIILSKTKKAPQGFTLAGEMNGLTICYKAAPLPAHRNQPAAPTRPPMPLPVSRPSLSPQPVLPSASPLPSRPSANSPTPLPRSVGQPPSQYPPRQANSNPTSPSGSTSAKNPPARPAQLPPTIAVRSPVKDSNVIKPTNGVLTVSYSTLSGHTGLDGVPFALGPRVRISPDSILAGKSSGRFRPKTAQEIEAQMNYSFFTERSALLRL